MPFTPEALDELQMILKREFGELFTLDQAAGVGARAVDFLKLVLRPLPTKGEMREDPSSASS